jgi:hypothetical protein
LEVTLVTSKKPFFLLGNNPPNVTYFFRLSFGQPRWLNDFRSKELDMTSLLRKMIPSKTWPTTEATIESCEWVTLHDHLGGLAGHYQVKFTYAAANEVNQGEFCHHGARHIAPYFVGERLAIQYDPKKPSRYHFNGADSRYEKLEAILVMTVFALLAGYVLYAF